MVICNQFDINEEWCRGCQHGVAHEPKANSIFPLVNCANKSTLCTMGRHVDDPRGWATCKCVPA